MSADDTFHEVQPVTGKEAERQRILERRARRAARRERQRAENIGRAKKMHQARLAYERELDSSEAAAGDEAEQGQQDGQPEFHVGCSGWFYWHWRDRFYPPETPTHRWFEHYAGQFKTVELNAPFYSWPTVAAVKTWVRQAGRRKFLYTVKVSELITHVKRFTGTKTLVRDFGHIADILGPYMGCFLFQLPPSYHYSPARLRTILAQLDPARRNVVEFRHKSWWNEQVFDAFREAKVAFCSSSGPRMPDMLVCTADDVYVRFHGTKRWYRHDYTKEELAVWVQRIRESGAKRVWAYFNNDRECYAIKNARELLRQLKRSGTASNQPLIPEEPAAQRGGREAEHAAAGSREVREIGEPRGVGSARRVKVGQRRQRREEPAPELEGADGQPHVADEQRLQMRQGDANAREGETAIGSRIS